MRIASIEREGDNYTARDANGDVVWTIELQTRPGRRVVPRSSDLARSVDATLAIRWVRRNVAVDGIIWRGATADRIQLRAEMDPPGGWVDVELATVDGRSVGENRPHSDSL